MAKAVTGDTAVKRALDAACYVHHIINGQYTALSLDEAGNVEFTLHPSVIHDAADRLDARVDAIRDRYDEAGGRHRTWDACCDVNGVRVGLTAYDYDPPAGGKR